MNSAPFIIMRYVRGSHKVSRTVFILSYIQGVIIQHTCRGLLGSLIYLNLHVSANLIPYSTEAPNDQLIVFIKTKKVYYFLVKLYASGDCYGLSPG